MAEPLATVELQTTPHPTATVIWLHGLGVDGCDFVAVAREAGIARCAAVAM